MAETKNNTVYPEKALADLCRVLRVDVHCLRAAAKDNDPDVGYTLEAYLNVLFDAGNSVQDVMRLVVKAAELPLFDVIVRYRDAAGVQHQLANVDVRARSDAEAVERACAMAWDERLTSAGCTQAPAVMLLQYATYRCPDGGEVRIDR